MEETFAETEYDEEESSSGDYEYYSELETSVENFIMQYRQSYNIALNHRDFSYVESFLAFDSEAYHEIKDYMDDISGYQYTFDFSK